MGNEQSTDIKEYNKLKNDYRQVTNMHDSIFDINLESFPGHVILQNRLDPSYKLILKEMNITDPEQFKTALQFYESRKSLQHPNILQLKHYFHSVEDQLCGQYFKIQLLFEFPQSSLLQQCNSSQTQIIRYLAQTIDALTYLHDHGSVHPSITPSNIYIIDDKVKLADPNYFSIGPNYSQILNGQFKEIYVCPKTVDALRLKLFRPEINEQKSYLFTLGLCFLHYSLNESCDQFFDYQHGKLYIDRLIMKLNKLLHQYPELHSFLSQILTIEEQARPDYNTMLAKLKGYLTEDTEIYNPKRIFDSGFSTKNQFKQINQSPIRLNTPDTKKPEVTKNTIVLSNQQLQMIQSQQFASYKQGIIQQSRVKYNTQLLAIDQPDKLNSTQLLYKPSESNIPDYNQDADEMISDAFENDHHHEYSVSNSNLSKAVYMYKSQEILDFIKTKDTDESMHLLLNSQQLAQFSEEVYANGSVYRGEIFDGQRHGKGQLSYSDNGRYDGNWKFNQMNGSGILYYPSGKIAYQGEWIDDKFQGKGVLYNQNPSPLNHTYDYRNFWNVEMFWIKYEGEFLEDLKHGKGTLYLTNGERFTGTFHQDSIQGPGLFYQLNGKIIDGVWKNNKL